MRKNLAAVPFQIVNVHTGALRQLRVPDADQRARRRGFLSDNGRLRAGRQLDVVLKPARGLGRPVLRAGRNYNRRFGSAVSHQRDGVVAGHGWRRQRFDRLEADGRRGGFGRHRRIAFVEMRTYLIGGQRAAVASHLGQQPLEVRPFRRVEASPDVDRVFHIRDHLLLPLRQLAHRREGLERAVEIDPHPPAVTSEGDVRPTARQLLRNRMVTGLLRRRVHPMLGTAVRIERATIETGALFSQLKQIGGTDVAELAGHQRP